MQLADNTVTISRQNLPFVDPHLSVPLYSSKSVLGTQVHTVVWQLRLLYQLQVVEYEYH